MSLRGRQKLAQQTRRAVESPKTQESRMAVDITLDAFSCVYRGDSLGDLPCGCGHAPSTFVCSNKDVASGKCVKHKHTGKALTVVESERYGVCETCQYRRKKPNTYDSVREWREAKFSLPTEIRITTTG